MDKIIKLINFASESVKQLKKASEHQSKQIGKLAKEVQTIIQVEMRLKSANGGGDSQQERKEKKMLERNYKIINRNFMVLNRNKIYDDHLKEMKQTNRNFNQYNVRNHNRDPI